MRAFQFLFAVIFSSPEGLVDHLRQRGANGIQVHRAQLEAVIQYELPHSGVHAIVLDSHGSEWREAGKFNSWWNFTPAPLGLNFVDYPHLLQTLQTIQYEGALVPEIGGPPEQMPANLKESRRKLKSY